MSFRYSSTELLLAERSQDTPLHEVIPSTNKRRFTGLNRFTPTDTRTWYQKAMNKYNTTVIIVFFLFICLGASLGALAYFLSLNTERKSTQADIMTLATTINQRFVTSMSDFVRSIDTMKGLYSIRNGSVDFYSEFVPFMQS
jgi:hypothetical protein